MRPTLSASLVYMSIRQSLGLKSVVPLMDGTSSGSSETYNEAVFNLLGISGPRKPDPITEMTRREDYVWLLLSLFTGSVYASRTTPDVDLLADRQFKDVLEKINKTNKLDLLYTMYRIIVPEFPMGWAKKDGDLDDGGLHRDANAMTCMVSQNICNDLLKHDKLQTSDWAPLKRVLEDALKDVEEITENVGKMTKYRNVFKYLLECCTSGYMCEDELVKEPGQHDTCLPQTHKVLKKRFPASIRVKGETPTMRENYELNKYLVHVSGLSVIMKGELQTTSSNKISYWRNQAMDTLLHFKLFAPGKKHKTGAKKQKTGDGTSVDRAQSAAGTSVDRAQSAAGTSGGDEHIPTDVPNAETEDGNGSVELLQEFDARVADEMMELERELERELGWDRDSEMAVRDSDSDMGN